MVNQDAPLTVSLPNGPHTLQLTPYDDWLENIRLPKQTQITVSAQKPLYLSNSPSRVVDYPPANSTLRQLKQCSRATNLKTKAKPLRLRPRSPKRRRKRSPPASCPSLAALFSDDTKTSGDAKTPSGPPATIHFYWPRPALGLGFLDKFNTAVPVVPGRKEHWLYYDRRLFGGEGPFG